MTSSIIVGRCRQIVDLDVNLFIAHTCRRLNVTLTHVPSGATITLFTDVGGTDAGLLVRLNDEAGTDIATADNPNDEYISGTFNPEGAALLSGFDGLDASGEWVLSIFDDANDDIGTLFGWTLDFTF